MPTEYAVATLDPYRAAGILVGWISLLIVPFVCCFAILLVCFMSKKVNSSLKAKRALDKIHVNAGIREAPTLIEVRSETVNLLS